jgi:hypothetical protein
MIGKSIRFCLGRGKYVMRDSIDQFNHAVQVRYRRRPTVKAVREVHSYGVRFSHRAYLYWHDVAMKGIRTPMESIKEIVNNDAHPFYWKRSPRRAVYYERRCLK